MSELYRLLKNFKDCAWDMEHHGDLLKQTYRMILWNNKDGILVEPKYPTLTWYLPDMRHSDSCWILVNQEVVLELCQVLKVLNIVSRRWDRAWSHALLNRHKIITWHKKHTILAEAKHLIIQWGHMQILDEVVRF